MFMLARGSDFLLRGQLFAVTFRQCSGLPKTAPAHPQRRSTLYTAGMKIESLIELIKMEVSSESTDAAPTR